MLRTGCLRAVTSVADRGTLPESVLAERLLPAIYAYDTNTGIRAVAGGAHSFRDGCRVSAVSQYATASSETNF